MYEIFEKLMKEKGVRAADVAKATGIAPQTLSAWKKGESNPKNDKLQKIADYFGVPIDYLVNGKETLYEIAVHKVRQEKFVDMFNSLSPKDQDRIMLIMESFLNSDEYKEKEMQTS